MFPKAAISSTICSFLTIGSCLLYDFLSNGLLYFSFCLFFRHPHCYWGSFVSPFGLSFLFPLVHLHYCCNAPFFCAFFPSLFHLVSCFFCDHCHDCALSSFPLHHCGFHDFASFVCFQICCFVHHHQIPDHIFIYWVKRNTRISLIFSWLLLNDQS